MPNDSLLPSWWRAALGVALASWFWLPLAQGTIDLPSPARIAVVGDGLACGMEETAFFELMLCGAFPRHQLQFEYFTARGATASQPWPGKDSAAADAALVRFAPHLVVLCLGRNDAGAGEPGLAAFAKAYADRMRRLRPAQVLALAPVVMPESPLGLSRENYAAAIRAACEAERAVFLDVTPQLAGLRESASQPLMWNGVDLNPYGHWLLAMTVARELRWPGSLTQVTATTWEQIRRLVLAKNLRHRPTRLPGGVPFADSEIRTRLQLVQFPELHALWSTEPCPHLGLPPGQTVAGGLPRASGSPSPASGGGVPELQLAEGYVARPWALGTDFPLSTAERMDFDAEGRLYLQCAMGRILCVEDLDRDQMADRFHLFGELPGQVTALSTAPEGVWVAIDGELWRLRDQDGDGRAECWDRMLGRFEITGAAEGIRNLTWGPTAELWFTADQAGAARLETAGGWLDTAPGCALYRFSPARGELLRVGPSQPGREALLCVGANDELLVTARAQGASRALGQVAWFDHGPAGPPLAQSGTAVTATACWRTPVLADRKSLDCLILAEAGPQGALGWFHAGPGPLPSWEGLKPERLVQPATGFSPCALATGPDGALYVLDRGNGQPGSERIWRIASTRTGEHWGPATAGRPVLELFDRLRTEPPEFRRKLRQELASRSLSEVNAALNDAGKELQPGQRPYPKPEALDLLQLRVAEGVMDEALLGELVISSEPRGRMAAARACGDWYPRLARGAEWLATLLDDEVAEVRVAALETTRRIGGPPMAELARAAAELPRPGMLDPVCRATLTQLGVPAQAPPAAPARFGSLATDALASGDLTPQKAFALWNRDGVPLGALQRAAGILAQRRGLSFTEYLVRLLEDRGTPPQQILNAQQLITHTESRELHLAIPRLSEVAETGFSREARNAANAGLVLSAVSTRNLEMLLARAETEGDPAVTALLEGAALVVDHPSARFAMKEWLLHEIGAPEREPMADSTRRKAALELASVLGEELKLYLMGAKRIGLPIHERMEAVRALRALGVTEGMPVFHEELVRISPGPFLVPGTMGAAPNEPIAVRIRNETVERVAVASGSADTALFLLEPKALEPGQELVVEGFAPPRPGMLRLRLAFENQDEAELLVEVGGKPVTEPAVASATSRGNGHSGRRGRRRRRRESRGSCSPA